LQPANIGTDPAVWGNTVREHTSRQPSGLQKDIADVSDSATKQSGVSQKPFAVFDIDGTLIRWQLYHAIADALARRGYVKPEAFQTIRESRMEWKRRTGETSFKDYEKQLIITYENVLKGLTVCQFEEAVDAVFTEYKDQVYTYTRNLISELKQKGYILLAISGSQTEIVAKIAGYYGFLDYVGTVYEHDSRRFSGQKTIGSADKAKALENMIKAHGLTVQGSIATGDSASDISMLERVEIPIAFNPEKKLFDYAKQRGWKIIVERKNMIYELEAKDGSYVLA
jgi:HAD superfamily hydrolase (TIGR01490 family)